MQIRLLEPKLCQNNYLAVLILFITFKQHNCKFNINQKANPSDLYFEIILVWSSD